jgi:hypothetical protein
MHKSAAKHCTKKVCAKYAFAKKPRIVHMHWVKLHPKELIVEFIDAAGMRLPSKP